MTVLKIAPIVLFSFFCWQVGRIYKICCRRCIIIFKSPVQFMRKEEVIQLLTEALQSMRSESPNKLRTNSPYPHNRSSTDEKVIKISNQAFIQRRDQYTSFLKQDLDARDKQIIIPFHFSIDLSRFQTYIESQKGRFSEIIKEVNSLTKKKFSHEYIESIKFTNSEEYDKLLREIQDLLSNMCENVTSITFRLLNENKLTDNEAKAFASKNFMVNIHSLMIEIKNAVKYFTKEEEIEEIIAKITTEIDESMMKVLQSMLEHYPQAPAVGQTARMREIIVNVNQSEDECNDLIFSRDIKMEKYLKLDYGEIINGYESYTGFIMEVINSAINVTRQYLSDDEQVSVFEKFVEFSQRLFCTSQNKHFKQVLKHKNDQSERLVDYYQKVLQGGEIEVKDSKEMQKKKLNAAESLEVIKAEYEQSLEKMREQHKYAIAQKIPNYVMPFNRNQLKADKFSINSSAILRIMTKWAQNLQEIFKKPEMYIQQRLYNYKNIANELFAPTKEMNDQLYDKLAKQYEIVKKQFKKLKQQNTLLQSYILSHNQAGIDSYLKRFTEVRSACSQINASLIQIMHKYLCVLIHHLLKAGVKIDTGSSWENINLVVFRVNDLLRSKFQCNETTFVNVFNTLCLLDNSKNMQNKFKLVRVKNKLNQKDNNILINYMFLGKVQCQLQLSIQDMKGKQKNYYNFNHYIYELIRGKFGAITECAIIVSQYDSTVNSCRNQYYKPKKYKRKKPVKENYDEQNGIQFKKVHHKDSSLFICNKCKELMVNHNIQLFICKENICNECIMGMEDPQSKLKYQKLRKYLCQTLGKGVKKIKNNAEIQNGKYILSLSTTGKAKDSIKLFRVWEHAKQVKMFLIQINRQILAQFQSPGFSYEEFNYVDIKSLQEKKAVLKDPTYMLEKEALVDMFILHGIEENSLTKLETFIDKFEQYRIEKNLIQSIKFKRQIINLSTDHKKLAKFQQILQAESNEEMTGLIKYTKYKNLEFNSLKKVYLTQLSLEALPKKFLFLKQLNEINLQDNHLQKINLQVFTMVKRLNINKNQLTQIDVSKMTHLSHLKLNNNELPSIDLSKNFNLTQLCTQKNKLSSLIFCFHPRLLFTLNDQDSQQCKVSILLCQPSELEQCEKMVKNIEPEYGQGWRNEKNCLYTFQIKQQ